MEFNPSNCQVIQVTGFRKPINDHKSIAWSWKLYLRQISWGLYPDRRDVPVGVPLDLFTPTGMSCIGTYGENCKSDNVSKYRIL